MRKQTFNLIEIVLALMVIAVGIVGVMGLFPVGLSTNRDAVGRSNAADGAEQFLHYMASRIRNDWDTTAAFPGEKPNGEGENDPEANVVWGTSGLLDDANVRFAFSATNEDDVFDPTVDTTGLFRVQQVTPQNIVDFSGILRTWKEEELIEDYRFDGEVIPFGLIDASSGSDTEDYGYVRGQTYMLKSGAPPVNAGGNFGCLDLDGANGGGANDYEDRVREGYAGALSIGDIVIGESGNMAGPTVRGVDARLAREDGEYVNIPVIREWPAPPVKDIEIVGFLAFRLLGVAQAGEGLGHAEVQAIYMGTKAGAAGSAARRVTLHAEISWPESVEYGRRNKAVYSLEIFKGAQMSSFANLGGAEEGGAEEGGGEEGGGEEGGGAPQPTFCDVCGATGDCQACGGDGTVTAPNGRERPCGACGGNGNTPGSGQCANCGGDGTL